MTTVHDLLAKISSSTSGAVSEFMRVEVHILYPTPHSSHKYYHDLASSVYFIRT